MAWYSRLRNLFQSARVSHEIDRELSFHVSERIDELIASGLNPDDARRQANRQFGNYSLQKEKTRDVDLLGWLESVGQDVRYALRMLRAGPAFSAVAILSLALGIGANTAIFSLIDAVILKSLPVTHPEQLLQVKISKWGGTFTNPLWEHLRDAQDVFSGIFAYGPARLNLSAGGEARYVTADWVSGDYFSTLGVQAALGRTISLQDDHRGCPAIAMLSYDFWQTEYGGSPAIIGKTIPIENHPFEITGVAQPGFYGLEVGRSPGVFLPVCSEAIVRSEGSALDRRSTWWLYVIGRPKPGRSQQQITARLATLAPEIVRATVPPNWGAEDREAYLTRVFDVLPVANGLSSMRGQYRPALIALMVVVGVVLLIACANVANLLLARALVRQREIAVRLAMGASRRRLVRQLLTESLLLSITGAVLGALFAQWASRLLVRLLSTSGVSVVLDLAVDGRVLAFTIVIAVLTGLLFGLAPAWRSTRIEPHAAMKANSRGVLEGRSRWNLGKALVAAQIALSLVLLVGAGLLLGSFLKLVNLDPGFQKDHVLLVTAGLRNTHYPEDRRLAVFRDILERLRTTPGVRRASASNMTPVSDGFWNSFIKLEGPEAASRDRSLIYLNQVSEGYFETVGTPMLAGRDFNSRDTLASTNVAVVNEALAAKYFGRANPLGRRFRTQEGGDFGPPIEIVGVVKDAKYNSLRDGPTPTAYFAASQSKRPSVFMNFELLTASSPTDVIPGVKKTVEQVNRGITLEFIPLAVQVSESLTRERLLATLSSFFGALALLLAMIGLYGVMSYNVARRRNEIGIRMALGAERSSVLRMVFGEVGLLAGVGLGVGIIVALSAARLVSVFLYGLTPTDPLTLLLAAAVLAVVAAFAGYLPARRASRLDPLSALREE